MAVIFFGAWAALIITLKIFQAVSDSVPPTDSNHEPEKTT